MRRIISLSAGVFCGFVACSSGALASPDIGIFSYPPQTDNYADDRPLAASIPRETIAYDGRYRPGSIVVDTGERRLYFILPDHQAIRYGIGVGRPGFEWSGVSHIAMKREWPEWTPPAEMLRRRPDLPTHMEGGLDNPLGARAMYVAGTLYRIHGSNEPDTIGQAVSSGCIRMTNEDVIDLYLRTKIGASVVVLQTAPKGAGEAPTE